MKSQVYSVKSSQMSVVKCHKTSSCTGKDFAKFSLTVCKNYVKHVMVGRKGAFVNK